MTNISKSVQFGDKMFRPKVGDNSISCKRSFPSIFDFPTSMYYIIPKQEKNCFLRENYCGRSLSTTVYAIKNQNHERTR